MRIILIAHNLRSAGGLSVGRNIVATLPEIAPMHDYLMVVPKDCAYSDFREVNNVEVFECPRIGIKDRWYWERRTLLKRIAEFEPDWIWALGNMAVVSSLWRQSLLFHNPHRVYDIQTVARPSFGSWIFTWLSDRRFRNDLRRVSRVYCQTETMCKRLHEQMRYPLDRIGYCPNAFTPSIRGLGGWPTELEALRGKFILFTPSKYYAHKNLEIAAATFSRYRSELEGIVCVLLIDMTQGKGAERLIKRLYAEDLQHQILCVGAIPQNRLSDFFHAADVMFLPTLLESFSGAYLEAMEFGTPILTSDRDFAHEVCADAAAYVDPLSVLSVKDGILRLRDNCALREQLVVNGRERLQLHLKQWPEILRDVLATEGIEHG